jgi:hypothetical protein
MIGTVELKYEKKGIERFSSRYFVTLPFFCGNLLYVSSDQYEWRTFIALTGRIVLDDLCQGLLGKINTV